MAEQEHSHDSHEDDREVVLLPPPGLVVDRDLGRTLAASGLPELDVLVDLEKRNKYIVKKGFGRAG